MVISNYRNNNEKLYTTLNYDTSKLLPFFWFDTLEFDNKNELKNIQREI